MSALYFGHNVDESTARSPAAGDYFFWSRKAVWALTCPGTGAQAVTELSARVRYDTLGTKNIKLGIYAADGTRLYASSSVLVDNAALAWKGLTWTTGTSPLTLTGGTEYILEMNWEHTDVLVAYGNDANDDYLIDYSAFSGGPPATLPSGASWGSNARYCLRCGVDPASSGNRRRRLLLCGGR